MPISMLEQKYSQLETEQIFFMDGEIPFSLFTTSLNTTKSPSGRVVFDLLLTLAC
jgi:hypothetical protein